MERLLSIVFIVVLSTITKASEEKRILIARLEDRLEPKMGELSSVVTKWLEGVNDRHLAGTDLGRLMQYEKIKQRLDESSTSKKMSMAMVPMIFHIGATSTWMMLTAIMTSKSVAIGLMLLVFKIAVSAAKLSSIFTIIKEKKHHREWSTPVHYGHGHEYARSMANSEPAYVEAAPSFEGYAYPTSHGQGYNAGPPSLYHFASSHQSSPNSHNSQEWLAGESSTVKTEHSGYYYR